jgi:hypothetical protein
MNTKIVVEQLREALVLCQGVETGLGIAHMMFGSSQGNKILCRLVQAGKIVDQIKELIENLESRHEQRQ